MSGTILHLALEREWAQAQQVGVYRTSTLGVSIADEGYLHACEDQDQLDGVVARYYGDVAEPLVVLSIDVDRLGAHGLSVRRERPVPGADLFPHVYGCDLPVGVVVSVERLVR